MRSKEVEESIEIFESWIDFNKNNKDIVNKADELIKVQENILSYIKTLEQLPNKIRDKIKEYEKKIIEAREEDDDIKEIYYEQEIDILKEIIGE